MLTLSPLNARAAEWFSRHRQMASLSALVSPRLAKAMTTAGLRDVAERVWEVWPAEKTSIRPAIFDERDLERVTGVDADSSREIEWRRIRGGPIEYRPVTAFQLRDAVLSGGHLMLATMLRQYVLGPTPYIGIVKKTIEEPALLTVTLNSSRYFGHWLMDELTRVVMASDFGLPVAPPRPRSAHQEAYMKLLGLTQAVHTDTRFRRLTVIDDRTQNSRRRERYLKLRERARSGRVDADVPGVMLLRRSTGVARILTNEEELARRLEQRGFRTLCPTEHSIEHVLNQCMNARVVVGVEGSQLCHALMVMRSGGVLVTLQPPYRFNNILKTYCDALEMQYALIVGHPESDGFSIDGDALDRLLDSI